MRPTFPGRNRGITRLGACAIIGRVMRKQRTGISKLDESLGLVFGWAAISLEDGEPYFDLQDEHIPEDTLLKAATDFAESTRAALDMHDGESIGDIRFIFPLTTDIAKALDIETPRTGLLIGMKPSDEVLEKYKSGEYTGFSIGGAVIDAETHADED